MKVLIIENAKEIMETIAASLGAGWPNVTLFCTVDGTKAMELVQTEAPHLVILDLGLPTTNALNVLSKIRTFSDVPIIALSKWDDEVRTVRALEMGADECISKPFSPVEFLAKVKALLRRADISELKSPCPSLFVSNCLMINFLSREVSVSGERVKLTPTEYDLLTYLVKNEGRVMPRGTLMGKVWGSGYIDDYHLLKKYVYRLRQKLNDSADNPQMLITERGVGYKFIRPKN